ncbi:MAG: Lrp/AsnC family transcriptional regulator [Chloroflexi bacterium]|nr:Lrp/AsnC family transcriptional regulator [Chloroflexota bacterium]
MHLTSSDRRLLTALQERFPLVSRPFAALGAEVGLSEEEALERVRAYREARVLREVHGVFDTRALGYRSVLVAAHVEPQRLRQVAEVVSRHPGVSHNYSRTHWYNLWFTLAVGPGQDLDASVQHLAGEAHLDHVRLLPMLRQFKIGVRFDLETFTQNSSAEEGTAQADSPQEPLPLSPLEIATVRALQEDLPTVAKPFPPVAERLGLSEGGLFQAIEDLKQRGLLRRYGALLAHREAGFRANAMVCWRVPPERAEEVGRALAAFPMVSHCYQRPTYPDWPYSHFTMLHARKRTECQAMAEAMARSVGIGDYLLLMSSREFKKAAVRYFAEPEGDPVAATKGGP